MKLTKEDIENLANELVSFLEEHEMNHDVLIYYNGKRIKLHSDNQKTIENISPVGYFQNIFSGKDEFARRHILSVSHENTALRNLTHFDDDEGLKAVFAKYGLVYRTGSMWDFSLYPLDFADNPNAYDGIEYILYEE